MSVIRIEWTGDDHDCETCGYSYASGANVFKNGELWFELVPVASCFGGADWDGEQVYEEILTRLGHTVETPA